MESKRKISRRRFLVGAAAALGSSALFRQHLPEFMPTVSAEDPILVPRAFLPHVIKQPRFTPPSNPGQVVHIRNAAATTWSGETDYWNYVDQATVDSMVELGLKELTGEATAVDAWRQLIPDYQAGQKVAIKVNFNNTRYCDSTVVAIDAIIEPINAVVKGLVAMGVEPSDICVYDAVRAIPNRFVAGADYDIRFYDGWWEGVCQDAAGFTAVPENRVQFCPPVLISMPEEYVTDALMTATYLISMPIMKGAHSLAGVTLGFKNHFGTISTCSALHDYVDVVHKPQKYRTDYSPLVDLLGSPLIGGKLVLTIGDGIFAARQFSMSPVPWTTFDNQLPHSLFFATDPVAVDCVMHDLLALEPETNVVDGSNNYLRLAALAGLGVYEVGKPWAVPYSSGYSSIDYTRIDV
ncbi:MAG: DUF362 domain-containing protein [Anaerolineae bacterium]